MADIPPPPPGFVPVASADAAPPSPPPGFVPVAPAASAAPAAPEPPKETVIGKKGDYTFSVPGAEPTVWDRIVEGGKTAAGLGTQAAIGGRKGIGNIVGFPVDAATMLTNLGISGVNKVAGTDIGHIHDPIGGSEFIDKLVTAPTRAIGFEDPTPQGPAERMVRRIGEEVGAAAVPVAYGLNKARQGLEAARELPAIGRMFAEPAAINPGKFAGREMGAATAAGTGAATVNEFTGAGKAKAEGKPLTFGQMAGDMGGAVGGVGTAYVGKTIGKTAGNVVTAVRGKSTSQANEVIRDVATDEILRAAGANPGPNGVTDSGPLVKQIEEGRRVGDTIPGFQESTADRTKNSGLAATEYGRQSGPNSGAYAARRTGNTEAIDTAMKQVEPQAQPGAFSDALETQRDIRLNDAATTRATAEDAATTVTAPLQPQGTSAGRGNTIRTELGTAQEASEAVTREAYQRVGINDNQVAPTTLAQALDEVTASLPHARRDLAPQPLIDRIANLPAGEPLRLEEASALKTRLLNLQREAAAKAGGADAAEVLGRYVGAVEDVIQRHITPEQRAALGEARGARTAQGEGFERKGDPVADVLATNPGGRPKMRDENVAALSTRDDAMGRILEQADTPATRTAIRNQLLSNADTATAAGLHDFQQRYAQQIARFPGLNEELGAAVRARVSENTARGAEGGLMKDIGQDGRGVVAKYLQYGDENAHKAMTAVMAHKDPAKAIDELLRFVGDDPKAVEGARKVFWDILQKKTRSEGNTTATINQVQPYMPAALKSFTENPATAAVAERLYRDNPEHWQRIKQISEAMQGVDVRNSAKAPNTSGTPQGLQSGILPTGETLASRIFAVERGVVSPTFAAINIAGIIARKAMKRANMDAVNKAIDKALLEPDFAATLLKENNPANRAAMRRATQGWKGHEASTLLQMLDPGNGEDETKGAVMRGH